MDYKKLLLLCFLPFLSLIIFSCGNEPPEENIEDITEQEVEEEKVPPVFFTPAEEAYISELQKKGNISVVSFNKPGNIDIDSDGNYSGFQYALAVEFADFLNVELEIKPVLFAEMFSIAGEIPERVKTDPSYSYNPDIFKEADLCVGFLTLMPWRQKIMNMVSYLPIRQMLVSRKDNSIKQLSDLHGAKVGYSTGTSYERTVNRLLEEQKNSFSTKEYPFERDLLHDVHEGDIDGTVLDLQNLLMLIRNYPNLVAELPIADIELASWGTEKGNIVLSGLVHKFFAYAHETGLIERLFIKQYSIGLDDYYSLIEYDSPDLFSLNLTTSEMNWLNEKRVHGKLVIATVLADSVYLVDEDGSLSGFDYDLIHNFARTLGLELEILVQEDVTRFFSKDGIFDTDVTTDPEISYTPDLLNEVDIYAGPFSIVPWREKLMKMVPMMPIGQVLAGREGEEIDHISGLDGKRLAVLAGSYQETLISGKMEEEGFSVEFSYMKSDDDPLDFVKSGQADYLMDGAVFMAQGMSNMEGLSVSPVKVDVVTVGWAVRKDNDPLFSILEKFINESLGNGSFGRLWKENNGVDFDYYLQLVAE